MPSIPRVKLKAIVKTKVNKMQLHSTLDTLFYRGENQLYINNFLVLESIITNSYNLELPKLYITNSVIIFLP